MIIRFIGKDDCGFIQDVIEIEDTKSKSTFYRQKKFWKEHFLSTYNQVEERIILGKNKWISKEIK